MRARSMEFSDLLCGCGEEAVELDERERLPPSLSAYVINAMQAPHEVLDVHPKAPPWVRRDNLRVNCVRLLARCEAHFESELLRLLARHDAKTGCPGLEARPEKCAPHAAALVAHALLEARGRNKVDDLLQKLPRLVTDGLCGFPQNFLGCENVAERGDVKYLTDDLKIECEGTADGKICASKAPGSFPSVFGM